MFKWFKEKFSKEDNMIKEDRNTAEDFESNSKENLTEEELQQADVQTENQNGLGSVSSERMEKPLKDESKEENSTATRSLPEEVEGTLKSENNLDLTIEKEESDADKIEDSIDHSKNGNIEFSLESTSNDSQEKENSKPNLLQRLKEGLTKTRKEVGIKINTVLGSYVKIDDDMLEDLEDILISADIGMDTTMKLIDNLRERIIRDKINDPTQVKSLLKEETKKLMNEDLSSELITEAPSIYLVVGVNGVGKTTTIGKLAARLKKEGKSVLIAAGDTFRAAAIDQLKEWGDRAQVNVISHSEGADPAAVIFDGIAAAKSRNADILICDTAGRLHNKANLMKELEKINRIINREYGDAHRETILVLDATTGQNAMNQAKTFKEACDITGIALTKLDGTAKGGVVIALQSELQIPIKLVGVGEGIEDLQDFNMESFVNAIFDE
ncbi:MAG: signal recognition particle-docking protein FtsY [Tissierellia bacterium]|nr:signal recognition particle-docking protein FtsY [Tissierellia bacterium]